MRIFKEKLGKSDEHWKKVRKNADLSLGLSLLLSLDLFLLTVPGKKHKHIDEKNKTWTKHKHTKIKNNVYFFVFVPQISFFPKCFLQNQHVAAKFHLFVFYLFIFFWVFCWVSVFQLCLFFVFFFLFCFELSVVCLDYIYIMFWLFFALYCVPCFFGVLWGIIFHNASPQ